MSNRSLKDHGIILQSKDFRETDKFLYIYLRNHGIVTAIAYGAKKSRKRFGGNLDPYHLAFFEIDRSRDIFSVKEVKITKLFINLRRDPLSLNILFNISAMMTCRSLSHEPGVFKAFYILLTKLDDSDNTEAKIKYYLFFIMYFLKKEGVFPPKINCSFCVKTDNRLYYNFSRDRFVFICPPCSKRQNIECYYLEPDVTNFIGLCLNPGRRFVTASYNYKVYERVEEILLPVLNSYLHTCLVKLSPAITHYSLA